MLNKIIRSFSKKSKWAKSLNKNARIKLNDIDFKLDKKSDRSFAVWLETHSEEFETNEVKLFSILASNAKAIVDIGANVGVYTIIASKKNPGAKIFSFEPYVTNFNQLVKNCTLNNLQNVVPISNAVGATNEQISFFVPANENEVTTVSSAYEGFTDSWHKEFKKVYVEQIRLDDYFLSKGIEVDLLKIDAEFHEKSILEGAKQLIKLQKPLILCEVLVYDVHVNIFPESKDRIAKNHSQEIEKIIKELGYFIYTLGKDGIMMVDSVHNHPDVRNFLFSPVKSNSLFIPYIDTKSIYSLFKDR